MSEISKPEPWVNTKEIAQHMGVTVETVRKWIKLEKIPCTASVSFGSLKLAMLTSGWQADKQLSSQGYRKTSNLLVAINL